MNKNITRDKLTEKLLVLQNLEKKAIQVSTISNSYPFSFSITSTDNKLFDGYYYSYFLQSINKVYDSSFKGKSFTQVLDIIDGFIEMIRVEIIQL